MRRLTSLTSYVRSIALLAAIAVSLLVSVSARADDRALTAPKRVALGVSGAEADTIRREIAAVLTKGGAKVVESPEVLAELENAGAPEEFAKLAREAGLAATIEVFVRRKDTSWTLTMSVHDGVDGGLLRELRLQADGAGPEALDAKVHAELWTSLRPVLQRARAPSGAAATERAPAAEEGEQGEAPKAPAARPEVERRQEGEPTAEQAKPPARAETPRPKPPLLWLSGSVIQDVAWVGGGDEVCTEDGQANRGYSCFRQQGSQYLGTPVAGQADRVASGVSFATTRLVVGADLLVTDRVTLGARVGGAVRGGGPTPSSGERFLPLYLEARAAYFLSGRAFGSTLSPFLFVAGGIAQIDAHVTVNVIENPTAPPPPSQLDNPRSQQLDVWRKSGAGFAAAGVGTFIGLGATHGFLADLRGTVLFPSVGGAAALSIGYAFGL